MQVRVGPLHVQQSVRADHHVGAGKGGGWVVGGALLSLKRQYVRRHRDAGRLGVELHHVRDLEQALFDRTEDERAIQKVLVDFVAAWNQHDMKLWSELFTDDADFVVVTAKYLKGREEIFKYHDELHKGPFKDHQMKASWQDMRFPRDDVALGHVKFEPGNNKMKRTALATVVVVKQNGRWLIAAFHNTLLYGPPLPEQFPPNSK